MHNAGNFWCGTDASLSHYLTVMKQRAERDPASMPSAAIVINSGGDQSQPTAEVPRLFSQAGGVGIITIAGPLTNTDSYWNKYDGIVSYNEIRDALIHAAQDPSVGAIVLDINSGGGAVSGVSDTAELIAKIDKSLKPVHTFSDGQICSAAYWLGSSARSVSIGKVAEAGSVGVLSVHTERSKMLKDNGIGVTVIRAGEFKALGSPYEALSDKARAEIQGQLDQLYTMFMGHVADARGVSYAAGDASMGQGRVFIGAKAVEIGLADKVSNFDKVVSKAQGGIDASKKPNQYGANIPKGTPMRTAFTEQSIAAMAEAGTLLVDPVAAPAAAPAATAPAETDPAAEPAAAAAPVAAPVAAAAEAPSDIVAFLKSSLAEANASLMSASMELRDLKASSAAITATHEAFKGIATASVDRLRIALGFSANTMALTDESLLADHASLRTQFESKFKAGGVAAVSSTGSSDEKSQATADPVRQARLASTRSAT